MLVMFTNFIQGSLLRPLRTMLDACNECGTGVESSLCLTHENQVCWFVFFSLFTNSLWFFLCFNSSARQERPEDSEKKIRQTIDALKLYGQLIN